MSEDSADGEDATESISLTVATAVADAADQSLLEIELLVRSIDRDALEALLTGDKRGSSLIVSFTYRRFQVTLSSDGIQIDRSA